MEAGLNWVFGWPIYFSGSEMRFDRHNFFCFDNDSGGDCGGGWHFGGGGGGGDGGGDGGDDD